MHTFVSTVLLLFIWTTTQAQKWGVELHAQKAQVFRGAQAIARGNPQAIELRLLKATDGTEWWHAPHQYPRFGININYLDFDDPILGQSLSAQLTGERTIIKRKRWQFNFVAGMGIAWITNPFDRINNNKNIMLSGNLNSSWIANFSLAWQVRPPWQLMFEFGIIHYSNGAVQLPNQGINLATANIGIGYRPALKIATQDPEKQAFDPSQKMKRVNWMLNTSIGFVERYPTNGFKYRVYGLHLTRQQMWGKVTFWQVGLEGFYNTWLYEFTRAEEQANAGRVGFNAGLGWVAGRLQGDIGLGVYLYKPQIIDTQMYERYGLRFFITPNVSASFHVKSQRGSVDNLEFGAGWRF
ncbi:MAG TPA: hypothetical protein DCS93_40400 [Microscillaceae bacterium]|nr:hypothetical protein [Microscillaceae bacterium]